MQQLLNTTFALSLTLISLSGGMLSLNGCQEIEESSAGVTLPVATPTPNNSLDSDADGLTDLQEQQLGTNIHKVDTDDDGLRDNEEVNLYHTDPLKADTDNDGFNDFEEAVTNNTDPLDADEDDDGFSGGPAGGSQADCNDHDPTINPGVSGDTVGNDVDTDCMPDVAFDMHIFPRGYVIEVSLNSSGQGVYVKTYRNCGAVGACSYHGETLVDPFTPNIPDSQSGPDGCDQDSAHNCAPADWTQPFTDDHLSASWQYCPTPSLSATDFCVATLPGASTNFNDDEGVGFKVLKLGTAQVPHWKIVAVAASHTSALEFQQWIVELGD